MSITLEDHGLVGGGFGVGSYLPINNSNLINGDGEYMVSPQTKEVSDGFFNTNNGNVVAYKDNYLIVNNGGQIYSKVSKSTPNSMTYSEDWSVNIGGTTNPLVVYIDSDDNIYIATQSPDGILYKYDKNGTFIDSLVVGASNDESIRIYDNEIYFKKYDDVLVVDPDTMSIIRSFLIPVVYGMDCFMVANNYIIIGISSATSGNSTSRLKFYDLNGNFQFDSDTFSTYYQFAFCKKNESEDVINIICQEPTSNLSYLILKTMDFNGNLISSKSIVDFDVSGLNIKYVIRDMLDNIVIKGSLSGFLYYIILNKNLNEITRIKIDTTLINPQGIIENNSKIQDYVSFRGISGSIPTQPVELLINPKIKAQ